MYTKLEGPGFPCFISRGSTKNKVYSQAKVNSSHYVVCVRILKSRSWASEELVIACNRPVRHTVQVVSYGQHAIRFFFPEWHTGYSYSSHKNPSVIIHIGLKNKQDMGRG